MSSQDQGALRCSVTGAAHPRNQRQHGHELADAAHNGQVKQAQHAWQSCQAPRFGSLLRPPIRATVRSAGRSMQGAMSS